SNMGVAAVPPALAAEGSPSPAVFPRAPGETPRAFGAFLAFFQLGSSRSLPAVAEVLGENPATVKNWSSKYRWSERLLAYQSGLLQARVAAQAGLAQSSAADWARRGSEFREVEWAAGQKLLGAVLCFLENFGDREVEKMSLAQVSRALQISTRVSRSALSGELLPDESAPSALESALAAALQKAYGQPSAPAVGTTPVGSPAGRAGAPSNALPVN
ncbi:MAG: hypothetical protein WCH99_18875, partial [Verrucomicrobiota bacterium]